jgi:hypothetical protein
VAAAAIVEGLDVVEDRASRGLMGREGLTVRQYVGFEGGEDAFGESVVVAVAFGAHALAQAGAGEQGAGFGGGVLAAAIGMEDGAPGYEAGGEGRSEGVGDQLGVQGCGELPAEDGAGEEVEHDGQIKPAFGGGNVGNIADDLGARRERWTRQSQEVGRRTSGVVWSGCPGPEGAAGPGGEAVGAQQASHPVLGATFSARRQFAGQARTAVGAGVAMGVDGPDLVEQAGIGASPRPLGPSAGGEIARTANSEGFAEFGDLELSAHGVNQRIPLAGSSESMLIAFFKISRWRRRYSFSRWRRRISPAASARGTPLRPGACGAAACAACPWPSALFRHWRSALAETPSSRATVLRGRPLLSSRSTAP